MNSDAAVVFVPALSVLGIFAGESRCEESILVQVARYPCIGSFEVAEETQRCTGDFNTGTYRYIISPTNTEVDMLYFVG